MIAFLCLTGIFMALIAAWGIAVAIEEDNDDDT